MPKVLNWEFKNEFKSYDEMDEFRNKFISKGKFHNNKVPCTFNVVSGVHKMQYYSIKIFWKKRYVAILFVVV